MVCPWQDARYVEEGPFTLKANNGICLWSGAIDIRESEDGLQELPNMGLLSDRHCLLFHYTDKQAVEVKKKSGTVFVALSLPLQQTTFVLHNMAFPSLLAVCRLLMRSSSCRATRFSRASTRPTQYLGMGYMRPPRLHMTGHPRDTFYLTIIGLLERLGWKSRNRRARLILSGHMTMCCAAAKRRSQMKTGMLCSTRSGQTISSQILRRLDLDLQTVVLRLCATRSLLRTDPGNLPFLLKQSVIGFASSGWTVQDAVTDWTEASMMDNNKFRRGCDPESSTLV